MVRRLHSILCLTLATALALVVGSHTLAAQAPEPVPIPAQPAVEAPPPIDVPPAIPESVTKPSTPAETKPKADVKPVTPARPATPVHEPVADRPQGKTARPVERPMVDKDAIPAAAAALEPAETNPLPPATANPGGGPVAPAGETRAVDPLEIKPEQFPSGPQTVNLSVSVVAPEVMNVNHTGTIKILVKNTGVADARAVRVHYDLPPEFELISAQPEAKEISPGDRRKFWTLDTVSAGSEQLLILKVKANKANTVDHAALVTLVTGSRSRTLIQEPMLKVETTVTPSKLLIGQQARFNITVSNPGSGPARDVVVRCTLSSGLKADGEEIVEQSIPIVYPDRPVVLDPLVVDTIAGGEQTCTVTVSSPDVVGKGEMKVTRSLIVLRPELKLSLTGPETRYTDTYADYKVTVSNPGTATAKDVRVTVALPANSGKLQKPLPPGSEWNAAKQTLTITFPKIDPQVGDKPGEQTATFTVLLGGPGMYRVSADARSGNLHDKAVAATDVSGMADLEMTVTEKRRVLDVGETTVFYIRIKNVGTKPAKSLQVTGKLSSNLHVEATGGTDNEARVESLKDANGNPIKDAKGNEIPGDLKFPLIDSLPQGKTLDLGIHVKALKPGLAQARILLMHDDLPDASACIEDVANTRITNSAPPDTTRK